MADLPTPMKSASMSSESAVVHVQSTSKHTACAARTTVSFAVWDALVHQRRTTSSTLLAAAQSQH